MCSTRSPAAHLVAGRHLGQGVQADCSALAATHPSAVKQKQMPTHLMARRHLRQVVKIHRLPAHARAKVHNAAVAHGRQHLPLAIPAAKAGRMRVVNMGTHNQS